VTNRDNAGGDAPLPEWVCLVPVEWPRELIPAGDEPAGFGRNLLAVPAESLQDVAHLRASATSGGNQILADEFATSRRAQ
jgi:hypothetical protein